MCYNLQMRIKDGHYTIQIFMDKFEFVEAKKFLALKGPLKCQVIQDHMYPILRFSHEITLKKPEKGLRAPMLACYWRDGQLHPCLINKVQDQKIEVLFTNTGKKVCDLKEQDFLGEIAKPRLSLWWRLKTFFSS